jgi:hypothetical protein
MSISWLAVRAAAKDAVLQALGLEETSKRDEVPAESPVTGAALANGWYVVVFDRYGHEQVDDGTLRRFSEDGEVVAGAAEEHVMCCFSCGWRSGRRVWWAMHDAQVGIDNLEIEGEMPAGFDEIRRERLDQQSAEGGGEAGVDHVFDIPLETGKRVAGFSYDETEPEDGFVVLRPAG